MAVVGAGGAARAVVVAAADAGARDVVLHARRRDAAGSLLGLSASLGLNAALADPDGAPADLVVIAASALEDVDDWLGRAIGATGVVHDLRYGRRAVATRNAALRRGLLFLDGASMLLAQALAAATLFAGEPVDEAARARAAAALAAILRGA